jgi:hypothetical protein
MRATMPVAITEWRRGRRSKTTMPGRRWSGG